MKIATAEIINKIDKACIERVGIPMAVLMENSALKLLKHMEIENFNRYVIVCGCGNNGGDGLALARHLFVLGKEVKVILISNDLMKLSECTLLNYNILKNLGISIATVNNVEELQVIKDAIYNSEVTVDALFGTGIKRNLEGVFFETISIINESSERIFSVDIPSGLNSDTGKTMGNVVRSTKTICLELYKRGFLNYDCTKYLGKVLVERIGIPDFIIDEYHDKEFITERNYVRRNIKIREKHSHKGTYGRVAIVAGSKGFYGAAAIATEAAVRSGSGLVTLVSSEDVQNKISARVIEAMTSIYEESKECDSLLENCNAVAFGPGLGNNDLTFSMLNRIIKKIKCPIVIDADGINVMVGKNDKFIEWNKSIIITPHLGEMSRLTGKTIEYIKENRVDIAKTFAKEHGIIVLLKGYETVITDGKSVYINPTGNSAMANGGMGDCLTGIITSFIGQGVGSLEAAVCGAYVHGYIGDKLSNTMYAVNATHIIEHLPLALKELIE